MLAVCKMGVLDFTYLIGIRSKLTLTDVRVESKLKLTSVRVCSDF